MLLTEMDKAYAAGFFDGEGAIMAHNKRLSDGKFLRVTIGQNSIAPLLWLKERWGGNIEIDKTCHKNIYHRWVIEYAKARQFIIDIKPYSQVKCSKKYLSFRNYHLNYSLPYRGRREE